MARADVDDGRKPGLSGDEKAQLMALRRKLARSRLRMRSSSGRWYNEPPKADPDRVAGPRQFHN